MSKEEVLKKHTKTVSGFHNLTDWHKGFIYAAMEEYAQQFQSAPSNKDIEQLAKDYAGEDCPIKTVDEYYKEGLDEPYYDYRESRSIMQNGIKRGFKAGFLSGSHTSGIREKYKQWCKETKRNGAVLVGGSINEFFDWLESTQGERVFTLDSLTDEQRVELFSKYCKHCGGKTLPCHCENDE